MPTISYIDNDLNEYNTLENGKVLRVHGYAVRRCEVDYDAFFTRATKHTGKFKGLYIVYKEVRKTYYASYNGSSESVVYALRKVARKKGDLLISDCHDRIRMDKAYIFTSQKAIENWPLWDEVLGYKPLDKIELLRLLDVVI